jgi:hypothetical protein
VRGADTVVTVDADPAAAAHDVADIAGLVDCSGALAASPRGRRRSPRRRPPSKEPDSPST